MTPQDALKILDQATQGLNVTRQAHMTIVDALKTIQAAIDVKPTVSTNPAGHLVRAATKKIKDVEDKTTN